MRDLLGLVIILQNIFLNSLIRAQFTPVRSQKLCISFADQLSEQSPGNSTNFSNYVRELEQEIDLKNISSLELEHLKNDESLFQNFSLKYFPLLKDLTVRFSKLDTLPDTALYGLTNLKTLIISHCELKTVSPDLLKYASNLKEFTLSNTELSQLPINIFSKANKLVYLNLNSNKFNRLPRNLFTPVNDLFQLFLNNNSITSLSEDVFYDLESHLMQLELNFNNINFIPENIFIKLNKLIDLKMTRAFSTKVTTLPSTLFSSLNEILAIRLNENYLENLPDDIFHNNTELEILNLADNRLTSLNDAIFMKNIKLTSLNLTNNQLASLSKNVFRTLTELTELYLGNNRLTKMDPFIFSQLSELKIIKIENNRVNMAGPKSNSSNLYNCRKLEQIHAKNNSISNIYDDWLLQDKHLELVDLQLNPISRNKHLLNFVSDRVILHLANDDTAHAQFRNVPSLELNEYASNRYIMDKNLACGSNCACVIDIRYEENRMILKCNRFNEDELASKIPPHIIKFSAKLGMEFILSDCNLTSLYPVSRWLQQLNVTKLSLSLNRLSHLEGLPELPRLKILELHGNEFTSFDKSTISILKRATKLNKITLQNNPWKCDCSSKDSLVFMQYLINERKLSQPQKVTCENSNKMSVNDVLRLQDLCLTKA